MALVDSCRHWLSTEPGVAELLVQYLHEKTRGGATTIERSACERLQQKSAVAIGRLSHSRDVGLIFVELHCELPPCSQKSHLRPAATTTSVLAAIFTGERGSGHPVLLRWFWKGLVELILTDQMSFVQTNTTCLSSTEGNTKH